MPTRVQNRPAEMSRRSSEKINEHDPPVVNPNIHHKEALSLRLALGSILAPKRPFTPASRSSSGTASPAHPSSFAVSGSPQPPPPPNSTPNTASDSGRSDSYLHPRGIYHLHTPSRLGRSDSNDAQLPSGSPTSPPSSAPFTPASSSSSQASSPTQEHPPPLSLPASVMSDPQHVSAKRPSLHAPKPVSAPQLGSVPSAMPTVPTVPGSGSGTPKAKFFETLDSKSAWDALIHGSFS